MPSAFSDQGSEKRVVLVCKSGPAFDSAQFNQRLVADAVLAHLALDRAGSPRSYEGAVLTLEERVNWLHMTHQSVSQMMASQAKKLQFSRNKEAGEEGA